MEINRDVTRRLRIELEGDLWGRQALALSNQLALSDLGESSCVVLSLCKIRRIDESGLAMLVRIYSHLRVRGSNLELAEVPVFVREMLERSGFSRLVSYADGSNPDYAERTITLRVHPPDADDSLDQLTGVS